jgi:hypothetical protein
LSSKWKVRMPRFSIDTATTPASSSSCTITETEQNHDCVSGNYRELVDDSTYH